MSRVFIAAAVLLVLTGCAGPVPGTPSEHTAAPNSSSRTSAFDIDCGDVLPTDQLAAIWGDDIAVAPYRQAGAAGSWEMQGTALLQDGVLVCAWALPGTGAQMLVLALDDAAEGFDRSEPSFQEDPRFDYREVEVGDGAYADCQDSVATDGTLCHWNVLAGTDWFSFSFRNVPDDELDASGAPRADGAIGDIVRTAIDSIGSAPRIEVERAEPGILGCNKTLDQQSVADALGVAPDDLSGSAGRPLEYALGTSTPAFGQVMWAYSYERLGYYECTFASEAVSGTVITAPGAAWILQDPNAVQPDLVPVAEFGMGVSDCREEDGSALCTVAVAAGDDLVLVQLAPGDPAQGEELALGIVRLLLPAG